MKDSIGEGEHRASKPASGKRIRLQGQGPKIKTKTNKIAAASLKPCRKQETPSGPGRQPVSDGMMLSGPKQTLVLKCGLWGPLT